MLFWKGIFASSFVHNCTPQQRARMQNTSNECSVCARSEMCHLCYYCHTRHFTLHARGFAFKPDSHRIHSNTIRNIHCAGRPAPKQPITAACRRQLTKRELLHTTGNSISVHKVRNSSGMVKEHPAVAAAAAKPHVYDGCDKLEIYDYRFQPNDDR